MGIKKNRSSSDKAPGQFYKHIIEDIVYCHHHGVINDFDIKETVSYAVNFQDILRHFKVHTKSIIIYQYYNREIDNLHDNENYNSHHSFKGSVPLREMLNLHSNLIRTSS